MGRKAKVVVIVISALTIIIFLIALFMAPQQQPPPNARPDTPPAQSNDIPSPDTPPRIPVPTGKSQEPGQPGPEIPRDESTR